MSINDLEKFADRLRTSAVFKQKRSIYGVSRLLKDQFQDRQILNGDDAAAIPDGNGYLLLAAEGIMPELLVANPYLAGRSAVLANVNDIYSMGGRPLAMVDVIVTGDEQTAYQVLQGMIDNAVRFDVPLVGGHTTVIQDSACSVSLAIIGRAKKLISSFTAQPGDALIMVYNPEGQWLDEFGFWDSNSMKNGSSLIDDLALLPLAAETDVLSAGKDISMAGIAGTSLMLAESSRVGLHLHLDSIPVPEGIDLKDWLLSFFSFGFVVAVNPNKIEPLRQMFNERSLSSAKIGEFNDSSNMMLTNGRHKAILWDWKQMPFAGFQKP